MTTYTETVLVPAKQLENAQTTQYTATGRTARITKCTVTNTDVSAVNLSINIVASGDSAGSDNLFIKTHTILPGKTYHCPEVVGQVMLTGGFISTLASAANALTCKIDGVEITS